MISAHTVFTNDRFPRAGNRELTGLETSAPTDETLATRVSRGTTIGANATIGPGVTLGEFSMVGMGSVVTRSIPAFALVIGNPARQVGWVSVCGRPLQRWKDRENPEREQDPRSLRCQECGRSYLLENGTLRQRPS